ncbi:MAG: PAC2 family protein [Anaerolineales bacterium]|nr:PAC2 family protein [Anaerolineales bacterium]
MSESIEFWRRPTSARTMIAGWHQWADAGAISSGLPSYLIRQTRAVRIGRLRVDSCYLFQLPGAHDLLRPVVKLEDGYARTLSEHSNEFFLATASGTEFVIFLGEEPHQDETSYAKAFFDAVEALGVERVAVLSGVHAAVPYDRDREVSCVYSLRSMREELAGYAVRFSDYEGGATIGMYLASQAEARNIELFRWCAYVPCYDLSTKSDVLIKRLVMDEDYKAWYDLMRRLDYMFKLGLDLADLRLLSDELINSWRTKIERLAAHSSHLGVRELLDELNESFDAPPFVAPMDFWERSLRDLFDGDTGL